MCGYYNINHNYGVGLMSKYVTFDLDVERMSRAELEAKYFDAVFALEELGVGKSDLEAQLQNRFRVTPMEAKMLAVLLSGRCVSAQGFMALTYGGGGECNVKTIYVRISNLRACLRPYGLGVVNVWGQGYMVQKADIQKIQGLLGTDTYFSAAPKNHWKKWSDQDVRYLVDHYRSEEDTLPLSEHLNRSRRSVGLKVRDLGLTKPRNTEHFA